MGLPKIENCVRLTRRKRRAYYRWRGKDRERSSLCERIIVIYHRCSADRCMMFGCKDCGFLRIAQWGRSTLWPKPWPK